MKLYDITIQGTIKVNQLNAEREVLAVCKTSDSWEIVGTTKSSGTGEYTIHGKCKDMDNVYVMVSDTISKRFESNLEVLAGEYIRPTEPNGYIYRVQQDGVLSEIEPEWGTTDIASGDVVLEPELYIRPQVHGAVPTEVGTFLAPENLQWEVATITHPTNTTIELLWSFIEE